MSALPMLTAPPYRRRLGELALLALLRAIAAGAIAIATRDVFLAISSTSSDSPLVIPALSVIAVAGLAIALLRWWEQVEAERLGQDYAADLRRLLFSHVAHLPAGKLAQKRNGGLSLRFVGDLTAVRAWVAQGVARGIAAGMVMPVLVVALFHLDLSLAWGVVAPLGTGLALMLALGPLLLKPHRRLRQRRARLAVDMTERLPVAPHLRHLGRLGQEQTRLARRSDEMIDASLQRQRRSALIKAIPDACAGIAAAAALWLALTAELPGAVAAGVLAATGMLIAQMRELAGVWDRYCAWRAAKARCDSLLALPVLSESGQQETQNGPFEPGRESLPGAATHGVVVAASIPPRALGLRFSAVCHEGLGPLDFDVPPGVKIGISGENGAGKSTILRLAAGLDAPEHGRIECYASIAGEGRENEGVPARAGRRVMLLGPGSPLLAGSLRKAMTLGVSPRPSDAEIKRVARRFGLASLIQRLGGLDGSIAEGGRNLSGGECRRILIVRAVLADPDLLLLDEPDDALDQAGRRLIRRLVRECRATVLYVTHDARQLQALEKRFVLENGMVYESGARESTGTGTGVAEPSGLTPLSRTLDRASWADQAEPRVTVY